MSQSHPFRLSCPEEAYQALDPVLRRKLEAAYQSYARACPGEPPWRITSGRRTLRQQGEEMAAMTPEQLRQLYGRNGVPSYVEELIQAMPLTPEKAYRILARRKEGYISRHLFGAAVDVAADSVRQGEAMRQVLQDQGLVLLDERTQGIPCLHVSCPQLEIQIVRE
ncbi:MAG: hypothetical protein ACI4SG_06435 [Oligosphaeraceae bacterium]